MENIGIEKHNGSCELNADTMNAHFLNKKQSEDNIAYETNTEFVFNGHKSAFMNKRMSEGFKSKASFCRDQDGNMVTDIKSSL